MKAVKSLNEFRIIIPEERFQVVEFRQDDLPGIAVVNSALADFSAQEVFRWHLSIMIRFADLIEDGMPSQAERDLVDPYADLLDTRLKSSPEKPNALFLARITWNGTRELTYRVYGPEAANGILQEAIASQDSPRPFDFRMDDDPGWKLANWHLTTALGR
ncbi:MAG: DUF695 domain-containing protein [Rhodothermia bacterium]|nr:DUF695 domain-containing protein [Rhodothermia bacterium]